MLNLYTMAALLSSRLSINSRCRSARPLYYWNSMNEQAPFEQFPSQVVHFIVCRFMTAEFDCTVDSICMRSGQ